MNKPRPAEPTYQVGEIRRTKSGVIWTIISTRPHLNGDPAYVRSKSSKGREKTFLYFEWSQLLPVESTS